MTTATQSVFAAGAAKIYDKGRALEKTISEVIESWAPVIRQRMAEAGVESHSEKALNPDGVRRVTNELFVEFFNGAPQAMHDLRTMASHNCVGFERLQDGDHLERILKKVKGLNNVSPGVKYVYQTYNDLCMQLGFRQRDKNKAQKEREAKAAEEAARGEAVSQETGKLAQAVDGVIVPKGLTPPQAIIALLEVYGVERGEENANWIAMLAAAHDLLEVKVLAVA